MPVIEFDRWQISLKTEYQHSKSAIHPPTETRDQEDRRYAQKTSVHTDTRNQGNRYKTPTEKEDMISEIQNRNKQDVRDCP